MRKLIFAFLLLAGCSAEKDVEPASAPAAVARPATETALAAEVYEYVYPHNTDALIENHYLVLARPGEKVSGLYYGTSDEFDDAREGYLPGFFVAELRDLSVKPGSIDFNLTVPSEEMLDRAVELRFKSAQEALAAGYKPWDQKIPFTSKKYSGIFTDPDTISFKGSPDSSDRIFKRKK